MLDRLSDQRLVGIAFVFSRPVHRSFYYLSFLSKSVCQLLYMKIEVRVLNDVEISIE